MWSKLVFFITALGVAVGVNAQNIELEVTRSPEAPGFFSVTVYAGQQLQPLAIEDRYVINFFDDQEAKAYQDVLDILSELGSEVITPAEATAWQHSSRHRLIWLGGTSAPKDQLHFTTAKASQALNDFEIFSEKNLGPIYLTNFTLEPNHNLEQIYPESVRFLGTSTTFYGTFTRPVKTPLTMSGASSAGEISATTPLALDTPVYSSTARSLGQQWEAARDQALGLTKPNQPTSDFWLNAFPWLLFILGVLLVFIGTANWARREGWFEDFGSDWLSKQPIEETPMYQDWEKNLPFEVVTKKKD